MAKTFFVAFIAFVLDQFSKWYVVWHLDLISHERIEVFPPYLIFLMGWNEGINFGLFADFDMRWVLTALAIAISVAFLIWSRRFTGWFAASLIGLIIGGALGNAIDRVRFGAVVDFLNMSCCGFISPYSFNIADVWVFAGAIGLLIYAERLPKKA